MSDEVKHDQAFATARSVGTFILQLFSLKPGVDREGTSQQIKADAEFGTGNIWALVFAILIASVGLNVNSTAVIIGAMLISPLMGPIVGAGFGLATNDFTLMRRSFGNLAVATIVALVTSTVYFWISPLADAQSELLARTRPTLYDVLIALFGGGAGIVAVSRKGNKGNVVPGVAIATALMPPLCTAGYGIAQGNVWFFLGALHLYLINALFIALSTLAFARLMDFKRVGELDSHHLTRARVVLALLTLGIVLPSVYTAWIVVHEVRFKDAARRFVAENFTFSDRAIVSFEARYAREGSTITATLVGEPVSEELARSLEQRMASYGLQGARLVLKQPTSAQASVDRLSQVVRQGVLEELYERTEKTLADRDARIRALEDEVIKLHAVEFPIGTIARELSALYPSMVSIGVGREVKAADVVDDQDATVVVVASWKKLPTRGEQNKLSEYLSRRLAIKSLRLVNTAAR